MNVNDHVKGASNPHVPMHALSSMHAHTRNGLMQLSRSLTPKFMLACFFFKITFSRNLKHSTAVWISWLGQWVALLYTTRLVYVLHRNEQLEGEHGGRTSYMYPRPNVTRQDMGHRVYKHTTTEY